MKMIYSLYIDIPSEDLDYQDPYYGDDMPKTQRTKLQFKEHYDIFIKKYTKKHKKHKSALVQTRIYNMIVEIDYAELISNYKKTYKMVICNNNSGKNKKININNNIEKNEAINT